MKKPIYLTKRPSRLGKPKPFNTKTKLIKLLDVLLVKNSARKTALLKTFT
jgi:hypothetical protein